MTDQWPESLYIAGWPPRDIFVHSRKGIRLYDISILRFKIAGDVVLGDGLTKTIHKGPYELGTSDDWITNPVIVNYL